MKRRIKAGILILVMLSTLSSATFAANVTVLRILREHHVTVATDLPREAFAKGLMDLRFNPYQTLSLAGLYANRDILGTEGTALFIIDRSKPLPAGLEAILPAPAQAIDTDEVLTVVAKRSIGNRRRYTNGWLIMVSAPNEKWARKELSLLPETLNRVVDKLPGVPTKLHSYKVVLVNVISTEGERMVNSWMESQIDTSRQAIDYRYTSFNEWTGEAWTDRSLLFALDRSRLGEGISKLTGKLPKAAQEWLNDPETTSDGIAVSGEAELTGGQAISSVVIAPCERHLLTLISKHPTVDSLSDTPKYYQFHNLSVFGELSVYARGAIRGEMDKGYLNDLSNNLISALSARRMGFNCKTSQDLKEIGLDRLFEGAPDIPKEQVEKLSEGRIRGLAVASLNAVDGNTNYRLKDAVRKTEPYPAFSTPEPREPRRPDPNDKPLFMGHTYDEVNGSRSNDPHYIADLARWKNEDMPRYEGDHRQWEWDRSRYEARRDSHQMEWEIGLDRIQAVEVSGNLVIYDARENSDFAGKAIVSLPLRGYASSNDAHASQRVIVTGEHVRPTIPTAPPSASLVEDASLISKAIQDACEKAAVELAATSVLPSDKPN